MDELLTAFPLTDEAEMPVNPEPSPENPVAVTVPLIASAVAGVVVPIPTRLFAASTNNVPESTFRLPDAVKVPVVVMAVAVTEPVAVMVVAVIEPALSTLKLPAFTVT
jgi:hypothetical protein